MTTIWMVDAGNEVVRNKECPWLKREKETSGNVTHITLICTNPGNPGGRASFDDCPLPKEPVVERQSTIGEFLSFELYNREVAQIMEEGK